MDPWDLDFWISRGRIVWVSSCLLQNIGFLENIRFFVLKLEKMESVFFKEIDFKTPFIDDSSEFLLFK